MTQRITPENFWATALGAMAEVAPYVAPALKAEQAPADRLHHIEVCLQDIIAFEEDLEDSLVRKVRNLQRTVHTQQQQIRNLQAWVEDDARGEV